MTWWLRAVLILVVAFGAHRELNVAWFYFRRRRALRARRRGLRLVITANRPSQQPLVSKG